MKQRLKALLVYSAFWLLLFVTARLYFIATHSSEAMAGGMAETAATFVHGLLLDISVTAYILFFCFPFVIASLVTRGEWFRHFIRIYTFILIIISWGIVVSDSLLYKYWGFRMDHTAFFYLKTPGEALASVTFFQMAAVSSGVILFSAIFIILYNRLVNRWFSGFAPARPLYISIPLFLVIWAALIIPVRGGTGIAPINAGTVYFSRNTFINHTAVNVVWNVGSSLFNSKPVTNPYVFMDTNRAQDELKDLVPADADPDIVTGNDRPNILMIVLESFGSALTMVNGADSLTTPRLNALIHEGVLFTNFYASGNRTDKAMPAILNGYPAQPAESIMKEPRKTQSLPGLIRTLEGAGYSSQFWYGGEINFANFNSFILNSGFNSIITMDNFSPEFYNSKWGVHDHILFKALMDSMAIVREPFVKVVLTLSSHEPFEVPMDPVFPGNDDMTKFRNSVYYTDRSLGEFIDWAKTTPWWANTLVVLVADHCRRNSVEVLAYSDDIFRIPMLWTGGAVERPGLRIDRYGSQTDIPVTILGQMGLADPDEWPFGKDLLSPGSPSYAFYTFNEGFAFVTDSSKYIYDHKLGGPVLTEGMQPDSAGIKGKAFLQVLFDDFLKR